LKTTIFPIFTAVVNHNLDNLNTYSYWYIRKGEKPVFLLTEVDIQSQLGNLPWVAKSFI
jgi:hypothetical protein